MILFTQAQRDAVRGDYYAGRLEPVEAVPGFYFLPERLISDFDGLDAYPTGGLLEGARAHMLGQLSARREQAETAFTYGGVPVKLDEGTTARLAAASAGLARKPSGETVDWSISIDVEGTLNDGSPWNANASAPALIVIPSTRNEQEE